MTPNQLDLREAITILRDILANPLSGDYEDYRLDSARENVSDAIQRVGRELGWWDVLRLKPMDERKGSLLPGLPEGSDDIESLLY